MFFLLQIKELSTAVFLGAIALVQRSIAVAGKWSILLASCFRIKNYIYWSIDPELGLKLMKYVFKVVLLLNELKRCLWNAFWHVQLDRGRSWIGLKSLLADKTGPEQKQVTNIWVQKCSWDSQPCPEGHAMLWVILSTHGLSQFCPSGPFAHCATLSVALSLLVVQQQLYWNSTAHYCQ